MYLKEISGVFAAVLTPRLPDDSVNVEALEQLVQFLVSKKITKFAVNGATGEFCLTTPEQLDQILKTVQKASDGAAEIVCGVGSPGIVLTKKLAAVAEANSVKGLLLPMPYYFPYQQEDLALYCKEVAAGTKLPVLLYNLPQFASGLEKETVRALIAEVPNIIGIKDSSGSLEILRYLTAHGVDACRIVGNDNVLAAAMAEGVCDGVVSGVACALPEVIVELFSLAHVTGSGRFDRVSKLLEEFIAQLDVFPTPWGLKWIVEARGVMPASFSQPVTEHRAAQGNAMAAWFKQWLPAVWASESASK